MTKQTQIEKMADRLYMVWANAGGYSNNCAAFDAVAATVLRVRSAARRAGFRAGVASVKAEELPKWTYWKFQNCDKLYRQYEHRIEFLHNKAWVSSAYDGNPEAWRASQKYRSRVGRFGKTPAAKVAARCGEGAVK